MTVTNILEKRIQYRIKKSTDYVFMLSDFLDLSDRDQVMRALRKLIGKGLILKLGQGVYVKAIKSLIDDSLIPALSLQEIGKIVANKLKIKVIPNKYEVWYNEGKSTQVPTGLVISVLGRINRKIGFNGIYIKYETVRNQERYYKFS
jgi:hypothetical protein